MAFLLMLPPLVNDFHITNLLCKYISKLCKSVSLGVDTLHLFLCWWHTYKSMPNLFNTKIRMSILVPRARTEAEARKRQEAVDDLARKQRQIELSRLEESLMAQSIEARLGPAP